MNQARSQFKCPGCARAILNRKIDRCLYCGATLPAELLFTQEQIDEFNEQQRVMEEKRDRFKPGQGGGDFDADLDFGGFD